MLIEHIVCLTEKDAFSDDIKVKPFSIYFDEERKYTTVCWEALIKLTNQWIHVTIKPLTVIIILQGFEILSAIHIYDLTFLPFIFNEYISF